MPRPHSASRTVPPPQAQRESVEWKAHEHAEQHREGYGDIAAHELLRIAGCNLLRVFRQVPDADRLADLQLALARIWRPDVRTPRSPAHPFNLEGNHGTAGRRKLDDPRVH